MGEKVSRLKCECQCRAALLNHFLQSIKSMCMLGNLQLPTCMSDANLDELTEMP